MQVIMMCLYTSLTFALYIDSQVITCVTAVHIPKCKLISPKSGNYIKRLLSNIVYKDNNHNLHLADVKIPPKCVESNPKVKFIQKGCPWTPLDCCMPPPPISIISHFAPPWPKKKKPCGLINTDQILYMTEQLENRHILHILYCLPLILAQLLGHYFNVFKLKRSRSYQ